MDKIELTPIERRWGQMMRDNPPQDGHLTDTELQRIASGKNPLRFKKFREHVIICSICLDKLKKLKGI